MKINWKWPAANGNTYAPWYVIALRLTMAPLIYGGIAITLFGMLISLGPSEARRWLRDAT